MYTDEFNTPVSNTQNNIFSKIIMIMVLIIVIIAIVLLIKGHDSAKLNLRGLEQMTVYQYDRFIDPGYTIDGGSDNGYYVNVEGYVNTNRIGIYFLKYVLYNKSGKEVSETNRQVIVLDDTLSNITLTLKGEDEEYFFIGDYFDLGAEAYQKNNDISSLITVDSNVNPNIVGKYEVKYQLSINNKVKEVTRKVNIIDLDVVDDTDLKSSRIDLLIKCDNYDYTILPDGMKEYSQDVSYKYNGVSVYDFEIFLKNGSKKKYSVDIANMDKEGPVGTCNVSYKDNRTTITVNASDPSGISKYSYNGLDFYGNTTTINSIATNITIRVYDKHSNYTEMKCQSEYGTGFRNIDIDARGRVKNKSGYIVCGNSISQANKELADLMQMYGYKTRWAVAAAGEFLAKYQFDIPYFWGGKYVKTGLNPEWGCRHKVYGKVVCTKELGGDFCEWGLDCTGLTSWAFAQAGFPQEQIRQSDQSGGRWGGDNGSFIAKQHRYAFNSSNLAYANQILPGDLVAVPGKHVALVIGVSDSTIQIVEMKGPIFVSTIDKRNGAGLNGQGGFDYFVLMEDFYKAYGNP